MTALLILLCLLSATNILLLFLFRGKPGVQTDLVKPIADLQLQLALLERNIKDDFRTNREEHAASAKDNRQEMATSLKDFTLDQRSRFDDLKGEQKELTIRIVDQLEKITATVEQKLEKMRETVDEKLQKTLNERLGQSFELVGKQLESVQKGLGEMQTLAQDVGGLKKVLSNVKMRGGFGEVQLSMLLENLLAPDQYESNVKTKEGSADLVEFAIKFPNRDGDRKYVWMPIDAKFPRDVYETLQHAYDLGDLLQIEAAKKILETTIKRMARDISSKYIDPPNTTDFGIMFLPFEGIFAEVVRRAGLLEEIQRDSKIIITGPTTLAAILNSLQMGFRTLAIQKRSSEVWQILGEVKREFETFGGMLEKARKNLHVASGQIDEVMGTRTRAIQRKLKGIDVADNEDAAKILPELQEGAVPEEDI